MTTYLIGYDLNREISSSDYTKLINEIKGLGSWAKPLESTFFVRSQYTASVIRDHLKKYIDSNDELLVIDVSSHWATQGVDSDVTSWMKKNI